MRFAAALDQGHFPPLPYPRQEKLSFLYDTADECEFLMKHDLFQFDAKGVASPRFACVEGRCEEISDIYMDGHKDGTFRVVETISGSFDTEEDCNNSVDVRGRCGGISVSEV